MNKFWLSFFVIVSFGLYAAYYGNNGSLSYVATPVAEVGNKNTSNTQVVQPPFTFFGDDDINPFEENTTSKTTPVSTPNTTTTTKPKTIPKTTPVSTPTTTPVVVIPPPPKPKGLYTDGTYIGSNENAYYEYVKVTAIISNGKLVDVQFPSTINGSNTSKYKYGNAMPILKSQAISAQSANVDGVSGATYTSDAFKQSLAYALTQAKN